MTIPKMIKKNTWSTNIKKKPKNNFYLFHLLPTKQKWFTFGQRLKKKINSQDDLKKHAYKNADSGDTWRS
jgi:hypothetical protein